MVIYRKEKSDLIDFLYHFYTKGENKDKTYQDVFKEMLEYKASMEKRSDRTIYSWQRYYDRFLSGLGNKLIAGITDDMLRSYIVKYILPQKPKTDTLRHALCVLKNVFWFARRKHYIKSFPEAGIELKEFIQHTDRSKKSDEDSYFTTEEIELLRKDGWEHADNPRALIMLLNIETGMRADEPVALHKSDIKDGYLDIHRQQIRIDNPKPYRFIEVDYTKNTRMAENTSRLFPITPRIQEILDAALKLPGESEYLFHGPDGSMIKKDSYELYLRRHVRNLGIKGKTNNHAIRKALNTNVLIARGIPVNERASLLGQTTRTNERNYSPRKSDRLKQLGEILAL